MNKEIEELTRRVTELEKQMKNGSFNAFGRLYSSVGSSSSDFLIKTKGLVKILWGNKFIDLIKNGKINSLSQDFINIVKSKDNINASLSGIYYDSSTGGLYIAVNGLVISLDNGNNTSYVSYLSDLKTTGEQKQTALTNIGFVYNTISEAQLSGLSSCIIYIKETLKLYLVVDGVISEYSVDLPNPYTNQFVISKTDSSKQGALIIEGQGQNNSLIVGSINIYTDSYSDYISSEGELLILRNRGLNIIQIGKDITIRRDVTFQNNITANTILSSDYDATSGFKLYVVNNQSYLEVDNLLVRNSIDLENQQVLTITPKYWNTCVNVILSATWYLETSETLTLDELGAEQQDTTTDAPNTYRITLYFKYSNEFTTGQYLYVFIPYTKQDTNYYSILYVPLTVTLINQDGSIYTLLKMSDLEVNTLNITDIVNGIVELTIFLAADPNKKDILRFYGSNIDLLQPSSFEEENQLESIHTRIGNISELPHEFKVGSTSYPIDSLRLTKLSGIFTDNLITDNSNLFNASLYTPIFKGDYPRYEDGLKLPRTDRSTAITTAEWVYNLIKEVLPPGTIVLWSGTTVPDGWALCDGRNGTPNLIDKFIKASDTPGETGGNKEITLSVDNLPAHSHTLSGTGTTSSSGEHTHTVDYDKGEYSVSEDTEEFNTITGSSQIETSSSGEHTHLFDLSVGKISETGSNLPINIEPLYYTLMFIMKLDY